jgi:two-component system NtrC family sensor kinase
VYETGIADVVNQLNNRLSAIIGFAELARRHSPTKPEQEALEQVAAEARQAAAIVRELVYLVRSPRSGEGAVHLGAALDAALRRKQEAFDALGIQVVPDLAPGLPLIATEPADLETLLVRLLSFAEARLRDAPGQRRVRLLARPIGASVLLTQTDSGPPLPAGHAEHELHYFRPADPGFLGHVELALAQRVAETCGAGVRLEAGAGGMAEVYVTLIPSSLLARPPRRSPAPFTGAHILLAEDDDANREALQRLLERHGHRVTAAADGAVALEHLGREQPDAIVLDLQMPRVDGREAFERLAARWPALARRVVFVTGDDQRAATSDFLRGTHQPVVRKPYEIAELLAAVAEVAQPK